MEQVPKKNLPAVILCGRSNVGKSSFINSFFNRKDLAKISSTPGKTRSLNFYEVDEKFYIVDLPGYGYAKTSKTERDYWAKLLTDFISTYKNVTYALHFLDIRIEPTELDVQMNYLLRESEIPYVVLLTKPDKLNQKETSANTRKIINTFPELIMGINLFLYSSTTGKGKREVQKLFSKIFYG